jgi:hypothetical protein
LFEQVCDAVGFAHSRLILHRDLKPSNILVTAAGVVKLLDFGTAKLLEQEGEAEEATAAGWSWMTPTYASPELRAGKPLQINADVWALGAVLYRVLTGQTPGEQLGMAGIPADLQAVIDRAMAPEPADRYPTVSALRDDLERWRTGRPVEARRGGTVYRVRKFIGRHRLAVTASTLIVLSVGAGAAGTAYQGYLAAKRYDGIKLLAEAMVGELFGQVQRTPGSREAQQVLVSRVVQVLQQVAQKARGDDELDLILGKAYWQLAGLQGDPYTTNVGEPRAALASLARAEDLSRGSSAQARALRALVASRRSGILQSLNETDAARREAQRAFEDLEKLEEQAEWITERIDLAVVLGDWVAQNSPEEAERWYLEAERIYQQARARGAIERSVTPVTLRIKRGNLWLTRDPARALRLYREAGEIFSRMAVAEREANLRVYWHVVRKEANALSALGHFEEARPRSEQQVKMVRALWEVDRQDRRAQFDLVVGLNDHALLLEKTGSLDEARAVTAEVVRLLAPLAQGAGPDSAFASNLKEVCERACRWATAARECGCSGR